MKRTTLPAILLLPLFLTAETRPFDAALTNALGWSWNDCIKVNGNGYYIGAQGAEIVSPTWNFAVTTVTLAYRRSASCSRTLTVEPGGATLVPDEDEGVLTVFWPTDDNVRRFTIRSETGSQNLYLVSIDVTGVILPDAPTDFAVRSLAATRCTLRWRADAPSVSLRLDSLIPEPESFAAHLHYGFEGITNATTQIRTCNETFWTRHPEFSGERVYAAAESTNVIQLSSAKEIGHLAYSGLADYSHMTLVPRVKRLDADEADVMNLAWILNGETNDFAAVTLETDYRSPLVPLDDIPDGATLLFNSSGRRSDHRVLIDSLDFYRDYLPACVCTNYLWERTLTTTEFTLTGLAPDTRYRCLLAALGENGHASPPVTVEFRTSTGDCPLVLLIR